jgi:DNA processing protein
VAVTDEYAALVALLRRVGTPDPSLLERLESEGAAGVLAEHLGGGTSLLPEDPDPLLDAAREAIVGWRRAGLRLLGAGDESYPPALRGVHDRPALVFVAGDVALACSTEGVAVVGSRQPSEAGRARAARFAAAIAGAGRPVLSGLAAGVDTAAHRGAIAAGGRTVAVIGCGHDHAYPVANAGLQAELAREHAVVSASWPEAPPSAERFRRRNGVMSGLSRGTVIVEAGPRSGTRVQARLALAHGRPVFLATELFGQEWARDLARRPGVHVVDSPAQVLAILDRGDGPLTGPVE